jgi:hypothetical protein
MISKVRGIKAMGLGAISNFSPMDVAFRRSVRGHPMIVRSRRPEEIGAVSAEPALVLAYKDDPRSHRGALRGAN